MASLNWQTYVNVMFDILTACISLLDLLTDIIVAAQYYIESKYEFFIPCCLIIIAAQLTYCFLFIHRYRLPKEQQSSIKTFLIFIIIIPFSPLLSFIFYFASSKECKLTIGLNKYFNLTIQTFDNLDINESEKHNEPKLIKWMKKKIGSHMGFIVESLIESFPQSVIQMTSMVIYNRPNYFSIISIILSLISVSTKSFVICVGSAIDLLTIFFFWLCIITDFIAIFTVISCIFYQPPSFINHSNVLFEIWFYKLSIFIIPGATLICLNIFILVILNFMRNPKRYKTNVFCVFCYNFIFIVFCIPLLSLFMEMFCWSLIALIIFINGEMKYQPWDSRYDSDSLRKIFKFINYKKYDDGNNNKIHIDINWKIQRICCTNYILTNNQYTPYNLKDNVMTEFLETQSANNYFKSVTYKQIRNNISENEKKITYIKLLWLYYFEIYYFMKDIKNDVLAGNLPYGRYRNDTDHLKEHKRFYWWRFYCFFVGQFIVIPLALISKLISFSFTFIMIYYIEYMDILQRYMVFIYIGLELMIIIIFIFVIRFHFSIWHLIPNNRSIGAIDFKREEWKEIYDKIINYYQDITSLSVIDEYILNKFGNNVGQIILVYLRNIQLLNDGYIASNSENISISDRYYYYKPKYHVGEVSDTSNDENDDSV